MTDVLKAISDASKQAADVKAVADRLAGDVTAAADMIPGQGLGAALTAADGTRGASVEALTAADGARGASVEALTAADGARASVEALTAADGARASVEALTAADGARGASVEALSPDVFAKVNTIVMSITDELGMLYYLKKLISSFSSTSSLLLTMKKGT
jgi:hypothetical protein